MRLLPKSGYRRSPWKNGGGETVEMLASPEGAGLDSFDWRISSAHVASAGPFSHFSGVDRTLSVLGRGRLVLAFEGRSAVTLDEASAPYVFPGDAAVSGLIPDGPIDDFNVMTRRGQARHHVQQLHLAGEREMPVNADHLFLHARMAGLRVRQGEEELVLEAGDSVLISRAAGPVFTLEAGHPGTVLLVDLWAVL